MNKYRFERKYFHNDSLRPVNVIDNVEYSIIENDLSIARFTSGEGNAYLSFDNQSYYIERVKGKWYQSTKISLLDNSNCIIGEYKFNSSISDEIEIGRFRYENTDFKICNLSMPNLDKAFTNKTWGYFEILLKNNQNKFVQINFSLKPRTGFLGVPIGDKKELKVGEIESNTSDLLLLLCSCYALEYFLLLIFSAEN
jgi:hypothetical protein